MYKAILKKFDYYNLFAYSFFVGFLILAAFNATERILISDAAYYLFNIINSSGFFVPGTRQTAILPQILVVVGVKVNLPLLCCVSAAGRKWLCAD